jgi:two-component system phosphate regulon sensor histidine kinase PhoR
MSGQKQDENLHMTELRDELAQLRQENTLLRSSLQETFAYIRAKVNEMLAVVGTKTLRPEELDDQSLLEFDPIGIVTQTFQHVLDSHRKLNQDLHFAHDEIQAIFDSVGAALLVLDPEGRILAYNQKTKDLLLDRESDIQGVKCCTAICGLDDKDPVLCTLARVMQSRREQHMQDWTLGERTFTVVGRPMFAENGEITQIVMAYSDMTARKQAETALLESLRETQEANAKIHGILRSAADSLLVTDASDKIILMNARAEQLFGFCLTDVGEKPSPQILSCRQLADLLSRPAPDGDEILIKDLSLRNVEGTDRVCQARIAVIRGSEGDYRGRITLLHDVTREREVEKMKSDFVSTAAHELRTPLSTILGYTDLLLTQEEHSREHLEEYLNLIQDKAETLAQIVGDLLDISRIEAGEGLQMSFESCDLEKLCRQVVSEFSLDNTRHQFVIELPESPLLIEVDRYSVIQILENVISNAIKYSPKGGEIRLAATVDENMCELIISDTGLGMLPDQLERVFEKFYRVDSTNTAISGTGLGLTIVKHLVDAHGGAVFLKSQLGQGTAVHIVLPRVQ